MENKQIVKNFYEAVVSKNLLQELHQYVSKDCLLNIGNEKIPLGLEGMREHLVAIKDISGLYDKNITAIC